MKNKTRSVSAFLALIVLSVCCVSCGVDATVGSVESSETNDLKGTDSAEQGGSALTNKEGYVLEHGDQYDFKCTQLSAQDYLDCEKLELGEEAEPLYFWKLVSDSVVLATKAGSRYETESVGYFDLEAKRYTPLYSVEKGVASLLAANSEYLVFQTSTENGEDIEVFSYRLSDGELRPLPRRHPYYYQNSILARSSYLLRGDTLYFDDVTSVSAQGGTSLALYALDLRTGERSLVREEMFHPMLFEGRIIGFVRDEEGEFDLIGDLEGNIVAEIPDGLGDMFADERGGGIYAMEMVSDHQLKVTTQRLKELISGDEIFVTQATLGNLSGSERFVSWMTYFEQSPCLYLIKEDLVVRFDGLPTHPSRFLCFEDGAVLELQEDATGARSYYRVKLK